MGSTKRGVRQTVDEKAGDLTVKQSLTRAAPSRRRPAHRALRLQAGHAPFDGIVTVRNTDVAR